MVVANAQLKRKLFASLIDPNPTGRPTMARLARSPILWKYESMTEEERQNMEPHEFVEAVMRMYPALEEVMDQHDLWGAVTDELSVAIDGYADKAREEGWSEGYFEAGGLS